MTTIQNFVLILNSPLHAIPQDREKMYCEITMLTSSRKQVSMLEMEYVLLNTLHLGI